MATTPSSETNIEVLKGVTVWFTGLPSSGKSTIARGLERKLKNASVKAELLDGDVVRTNLSRGLGFGKEDREINIKRVGFVCQLLTKNNIIAVASLVSPYRSTRDENRRLIGNFLEVFVKTETAECEKRDVKGLYKKARAGEIKGFTGVDDPYEEPLNPEVTCETILETPEESVEKVFNRLVELGYLKFNA